jgi:hypothetical protein
MLPPIVERPGRGERNYQFNPTLLMLAGSMFKRDPAPRTSFSAQRTLSNGREQGLR